MPGLTMLTFADLTAEIDKKLARVRDDESRLHWERLKEVVEGVAGETSAADFDPTGTGDTWWLTKVQVFGFRGIPAEGLELELPTGPGLTIVHGANGAGKSSLAGAIDVGLHTSADASITRRGGSGGNAAVWQPVLVNAAAPEGRILLELRSSEREGLVIECLVQGGDVVEHTATYAKSSGEQTTLALGAAWQSVLHAYGPVYAYSAWEQYIQAAKDLKDYISRLLLLGGCFSAVQAAIDVRTNQGQRAVQAINDAVREGESAVTQIEEQFERKLGSGLPVATVDIDEWWEGLSLPDPSGESSVGFSDVNLDEFFESVQAAHAVADELHGADAQRNVSLVQALTAVSSLKPEVAHTGECPVCGSETDWRAHLHDVLKGDDKTIEMVDRWGESLALLKEQAKHVLDSLLPVADPAQASSLEEARTAWDRLEEATPFNRALESTAARNAALDLIHVLTSHEFRTQAAVARERASIEAAWKQALANSLAPLRSALREHGDSARDHAASAGAHGKLRELERLLYASRKDALKTATDKALRHLLRDAGVKIQGLEVLRTKADIRLTDLGGRDLELGMLSAGQRNALLLAPALAVAEASPFGFFIMDDPVHAFDELRVDYVARQLMSVAEHRRLVVFTHDERLREHLLSAPMDVDCRSIHRVPVTGEIELVTTSPMWELLLDDAHSLLNLDLSPEARKGLTTGLRGICRQAVDNALRLLVTREAIRAGEDTANWLHMLEADSVRTTDARLKAAKNLLVSTTVAAQVGAAIDTLSVYKPWWDKASHGNDPLPGAELFTQEELDAARTACTELMA